MKNKSAPPHNPAHPWPAVAGWCMTCWHLCNARAKHTTAAGISKSKAHKSSTSPTSWEARLEEMRYITEMQSRSSYMQSRVGGGLLKSRSQSSLLDPPSLITSSCHWALTCMRSLCSVTVLQCYSVTVLQCYSVTVLQWYWLVCAPCAEQQRVTCTLCFFKLSALFVVVLLAYVRPPCQRHGNNFEA